MLTRSQIEANLCLEIERATKHYRVASDYLAQVTYEIPSGTPEPDGILRIKSAGEQHRAALQVLRAALEQWHWYTLHGTVSDDFWEQSRAAGAAQ